MTLVAEDEAPAEAHWPEGHEVKNDPKTRLFVRSSKGASRPEEAGTDGISVI